MSAPITQLNAATAKVDRYLTAIRLTGGEGFGSHWIALQEEICAPVLKLEEITLNLAGISNRNDQGTAVDLLGKLKDGSISFDPEKSPFGSYAYWFLYGDAKDLARKERNRARLLRDKISIPRSRIQSGLPFDAAMDCLTKVVSSSSLEDRIICEGLWLDPTTPTAEAIARRIKRSPGYVSCRRRKLQDRILHLVTEIVAV